MSRLTPVAACATLLVFLAAPLGAQSWEVSGLAGFTPSSAIDRRARELNQLDVSGGFTWGVQGARFFAPRWGAEVLLMQQSSALQLGTTAGSTDLFTITTGQLQGNVVYRFSGADRRLQPFAFAGLGSTFFRADDVPSETKLSLGFGGGVKYFFSRVVGVRGHVRYKPTMLNDTSSGDFCDPFGFCQGTLQQVEFAAVPWCVSSGREVSSTRGASGAVVQL
jgi:Outer membrane protein beta-barrel domain